MSELACVLIRLADSIKSNGTEVVVNGFKLPSVLSVDWKLQAGGLDTITVVMRADVRVERIKPPASEANKGRPAMICAKPSCGRTTIGLSNYCDAHQVG